MSVRAMTWVWDLTMPTSQKLVLLALADRATEDGLAWPGIQEICHKCNLSKRSLIYILQKLEQAGFITRHKRYAQNGHRSSNVYQLNMAGMVTPSLSANIAPSIELSANIAPRLSAKSDRLSATGCTNIRTTIEPSIKNSTSKNKFSDADMTAAKWIFAQVKRVKPDIKAPKLESWANTIRLMVEIDKRTHKQICELFQWANKHHFWFKNILCPDSLRKQWDRLALERNGKPASQKRGLVI